MSYATTTALANETKRAMAAEKALSDRLAKLEAAPVQPPTVPAAPITIPAGAANVVIDGKAFSGTSGVGFAIHAAGTAANPIRGLTITNCTTKGFNVALWLEYVTGLTIDGNTLDDAGYAGILALGCTGGTARGSISKNLIRRVGPQRLPVPGEAEIDAYGIAIEQGAPSSDIDIADSVVEDVPIWQGINAHIGDRIVVRRNVVRRARRAYWFAAPDGAPRITSLTVDGNRAESCAFGGNAIMDPTAYFVSNTDKAAVTNNTLSPDWPVNADGGEWSNYVRDYGAHSTGLVRSGNARS